MHKKSYHLGLNGGLRWAVKHRSQDQPLSWHAGRCKRAFELHAQGWSQHRIARALGVSQAAVSRWLASGRWQGSVPERRGVKPRLEAKSLCQLPDLLNHGAEVWGFCGELWTCARVAAVIKEEFGVTYSRAHVSRLLKALEWTPQRPSNAPASATRRPSTSGALGVGWS